MNSITLTDAVSLEADRGLQELLALLRRGATMDEALALFPLVGEEMSPEA